MVSAECYVPDEDALLLLYFKLYGFSVIFCDRWVAVGIFIVLRCTRTVGQLFFSHCKNVESHAISTG